MKDWHRAVLVLAAAFLAGRLAYELALRTHWFLTMVSWVVGVAVGVAAYFVIGSAPHWFSGHDDSDRPESEGPSTLRWPLRPLPGLWQLLQLAIAIYLLAVTQALIINSMYYPRNMRLLSIAIGVVVAFGGAYWTRRSPSS